MSYFITLKGSYADNGIYEFSKTVDINDSSKFTVNIYAQSRYILYINDTYICEGPCRSSHDLRYYDTVETDVFKIGKNNIKVIVLHLTDNTSFTTVFKAPKPVLLFQATNEKETVISDTSWKCVYKEEHKLFYPKAYFSFLPPFEEIRTNGDVCEKELMAMEKFDFNRGFYAPYGCTDGLHLVKREIPIIYPGEEIEFKTVKSGDNFIELDAGVYTTAKIYAEIAKQSNVKIIYSECYRHEDGKRKRDDTTGYLEGSYDVIHTDDNTYEYKSFWFRAFRFIRIEADNINEAIISFNAKKCHYPLAIDCEFDCSDEYYNKMHEISINTMLCCMHEVFVDCPHYEQQQYAMDSAIEASVLMRMSHDVSLVKKCISEFAASQLPDGTICANYPNCTTQVIPGFSFFWIYLLRDYLEYSGDSDFARHYIPTVDKVLNHFDEIVKKYGYITKDPEWWNFVDWVPEWYAGVVDTDADEAYTIYNIYYACALKDAAYICTKSGRKALSEEYTDRYNEMVGILKRECYDEKRGLFRDGSKTAKFSQHTIMWSILADIVSGEEAEKAVSHLWDSDLRKSSFSMNYYLFRALEKCGCYEQTENVFDGWRKMIDLNCTTWCENPDEPRSECHGWSSAPLYEFSANILGVKSSYDDEIIIKPYIGNLSYAKGSVPTRFGLVKVSWSVTDGDITVEINAPDRIKKQLVLPNGKNISFTNEHLTVNEKIN